jgi:hypothetical protein
MLRNTLVPLIALFAISACDKSSPDSAPPDIGGVPADDVPGPDADAPAADAPAADAPTADPGGPAPEDESDVDDDDLPPVAMSPTGPSPVPADPAHGLTEATNMATVRLEIKDDTGKVFKDSPKVLRWDEPFRIPLEIGDQVHEVDVEVSREGKTVEIVLGYLLGGQELVRNFRLETNANKRELVRIEGGIALAITVGSKTIKPKPQKERDKVEAATGTDPLAGAER